MVRIHARQPTQAERLTEQRPKANKVVVPKLCLEFGSSDNRKPPKKNMKPVLAPKPLWSFRLRLTRIATDETQITSE